MPAENVLRTVSSLEAEGRSELARERSRHDYTAGRYESDRLLELAAADVAVEVVAVVRTIGEIEGLEEHLHVAAFFDLEQLAEAGVELEERLATYIVEGIFKARTCAQASACLRCRIALGCQVVGRI